MQIRFQDLNLTNVTKFMAQPGPSLLSDLQGLGSGHEFAPAHVLLIQKLELSQQFPLKTRLLLYKTPKILLSQITKRTKDKISLIQTFIEFESKQTLKSVIQNPASLITLFYINNELFFEILDQIFIVWGDKEFINNATFAYQKSVCVALMWMYYLLRNQTKLSILKIVQKLLSDLVLEKNKFIKTNRINANDVILEFDLYIEKLKDMMVKINLNQVSKEPGPTSFLFKKFFKSVQLYLGCVRTQTREMAFVVADYIAEQGGMKLELSAGLQEYGIGNPEKDIEKILADDIGDLKEFFLNQIVNLQGNQENIQNDNPTVEIPLEEKIKPVKSEDRPRTRRLPKQISTKTDIKIKLPTLNQLEKVKFTPILSTDKTPRFISPALKMISSKDPAEIHLSLKTLPVLLKRCSQTELFEHLEKTTDLLLTITNEYDLDSFDELIIETVCIIIIREHTAYKYLIKHLFSTMGVMNRIMILKIMNMVIVKINPNMQYKNDIKNDKPSVFYAKLFLDAIYLNLEDPNKYERMFILDFSVLVAKNLLLTMAFLGRVYKNEKVYGFLCGFEEYDVFRAEIVGVLESYLQGSADESVRATLLLKRNEIIKKSL